MNRKLLFHRILLFSAMIALHACLQTDSKPPSGGSSTNSKKSGAAIFDQNCKICHGIDGQLGLNGAKDLSKSQLSLTERVSIITNGKNVMTPFGKILSSAEIDSVAAFTLSLKI
jgi:cytochrome c6